MSTPSDRRVFERYAALGNRTRLEWWDGVEHRNSVGRLVNVSQGGALVETSATIPPAHSVWVRLEEPARSAWVGARLVRLEDGERAALAFHQPCPFDFLESARQGISLDGLI